MKSFLAQRRKLLAYVLGVAVALTSAGLLHGQVLTIALTAEAVATGLGIHQVANASGA